MATATKEVMNPPLKKYGSVVLTLENVLLPPEKLSPSPSQLDGLDSEIEMDLRILGCELIQTGGILLKLPQVAMAAGQVLFQRFYYAKSMVRYPMETTAMACIALASKIEEAPRKIRDVINVFNHVRQVKNGKTIQPVILDSNYIALKNQVIKAERRLLKELGFCCHVKHPHKIIIMYLRLVEADNNRQLAQTSWNYMNDALRTDVFVRYCPETIACACIWLAARLLKVPLPEHPAWYLVLQATQESIEDIAASILKLYTRKKVKLEALEQKVEEIRREQQEARLRSKAVASLTTPQANTTFSPASRNNTPNKTATSPTRKRSSSPDRNSGRKRSGSSASRSRSRSRSHSRSSHRRSRKKQRRDSRSSRSPRSHSRSRSRSRTRSRSHSRDRHRGSKKYSRTPSPNVTPPPRFTKNKDKGPIVRSRSRSHTRSPQRNYEKYDRFEKYEKVERYSSKSDRYEKNDRYVRDEKVSKYENKEKSDKYSSKYSSKFDRYEVDKKKYDRDENKKYYDNGFGKPHKAKKNGRHRSRSRDRRR
ncbi:cyclin-L2-like [Penaeus japonicus]|uniref:cyclin-L2-like n=1 Tax=Penaeus japonicus TaxID=27405 RepID=UPI001C70CC5C|nr:cyclin-L2-like [Penaeus japonicus]